MLLGISEAWANEEQILQEVNNQRAIQGLKALQINPKLGQAAQKHSQDMAKHDNLSHQSSDGSSLKERVERENYNYRIIAENVAAGQKTPQEVVKEWMQSPGHRKNMLNPDVTHLGSGYVLNQNSSFRHYWTLVLGAELPANAKVLR